MVGSKVSREWTGLGEGLAESGVTPEPIASDDRLFYGAERLHLCQTDEGQFVLCIRSRKIYTVQHPPSSTNI